MVRAKPGDAITTDNPEARETARQPADPLGQLGVGDRMIPGDDRRTIRIDPRSPFDPRAPRPRDARTLLADASRLLEECSAFLLRGVDLGPVDPGPRQPARAEVVARLPA